MEAGPGAFWVGEEEKKEVLEVLDSGYVVRYGSEDDPAYKQKTYTLEKELAKLVGVNHAIAVNSGTSALFIGLLVKKRVGVASTDLSDDRGLSSLAKRALDLSGVQKEDPGFFSLSHPNRNIPYP